MTAHQRYIQYRKDELYHYNHNHDPRDGRFTSGKGGSAPSTPSSPSPDKSSGYVNDNAEFLNKISASRDFSIGGGDLGGLTEYMLEYDQPVKKKFLESEDSYQKRRREAFDNRMAAYWMYTDTSKIADKKQKAAVESRIFNEASGKSKDVDSFVSGGISIALSTRIHNQKYFETFGKALGEMKPPDTKFNSYQDVVKYVGRKLSSGDYKRYIPDILKDAGYEDTKDAREFIDKYLIETVASTYAEKYNV